MLDISCDIRHEDYLGHCNIGKKIIHFYGITKMDLEECVIKIQDEELADWKLDWIANILPHERDHLYLIPIQDWRTIHCHQGKGGEYYFEFFGILKQLVEKIQPTAQ